MAVCLNSPNPEKKLDNISLLSLPNIYLKANKAVQRARVPRENKAFKLKIGCLIVR